MSSVIRTAVLGALVLVLSLTVSAVGGGGGLTEQPAGPYPCCIADE